jgi:hypothetical protein
MVSQLEILDLTQGILPGRFSGTTRGQDQIEDQPRWLVWPHRTVAAVKFPQSKTIVQVAASGTLAAVFW